MARKSTVVRPTDKNVIPVSIDKLVKDAYSDYAKFVDCGGRTICDDKDSLKLVQRRILYAAYTIGKSTNFKFTKTATVVGETIGKYNPHGDSSCAGALYGMVNDGILEGKGNCGSTVGLEPIEPAAMRYTECRISDKIRNMCFKYINDVPYVINDLGFEEPQYIPTPLPLNLCHLSNNETWTSAICFGLAYTLPKFDMNDLYAYLESLVTNKPFTGKIHVVYRSLKTEAPKELIDTGAAVIRMKASYYMKDDGKTLIITEFPPMKTSPQRMISKFNAVPSDFSKDTTHIELAFGRGSTTANYDCDTLLTGKQTVDMYFHKNNDFIKHYELKEILLSTYDCYKKAIDNNLTKCYNSYVDKIENLKLMIQMKPYLNPLDSSTAGRVSKGLNIPMTKANELLRNSIKSICEADKTLIEVEAQLKSVEKKRRQLDKYCLSEIQAAIA